MPACVSWHKTEAKSKRGSNQCLTNNYMSVSVFRGKTITRVRTRFFVGPSVPHRLDMNLSECAELSGGWNSRPRTSRTRPTAYFWAARKQTPSGEVAAAVVGLVPLPERKVRSRGRCAMRFPVSYFRASAVCTTFRKLVACM